MFDVSMPHAALWVVQQRVFRKGCCSHGGFNAARGFVGGAAIMEFVVDHGVRCFNAARGFVGGAATKKTYELPAEKCFNAARGFVGGAASSLSALVPLRGKSPFGKSPEI